MSVRPFSPSDLWQFPKPPHDKRRSRPPTRVVSPESAEMEVDALTAESADTETASHFARVETIRRPFEPALEDEMGVVPGERVRMLQRFPDGWAYAEKVGSRRRGIIPIDCLRTPEEDLPAFLASKRLSSYRPLSVHTKSEETEYSTSGLAI
ncbi:hypothetical protein DAEQUDRAFT_661785 [Daedalea quercina L-15889]|uniref:SH3 domain-containing protein n=1 Tax=Daedalea quercina L-15889 TaxID=1314783 RepID=A0A165TU13_9APHY|nr:hypothetical protein DAEQUDRAFT_661785 [Daedalea quercina L-15889]